MLSFCYYIAASDHLDEVKNMHKNDTDCIVWSQPPSHTDIELEYGIKFMYYNGTVIDNTTSNLTEYCLTNITFDECKLVSVSVVAKAVCGDASSNITWWNGSVLGEFSSIIVEHMNSYEIFLRIKNTMEQLQCQFSDGGKWCSYIYILHCK